MTAVRCGLMAAMLLAALAVAGWGVDAENIQRTSAAEEVGPSTSTLDVGSWMLDVSSPSSSKMSIPQAAILGAVEGVTEYLPISSTGHLLLAQSLMGLGGEASEREAAEAYSICIQAGAILAVVGLYFGRLRRIVRGLLGADREGLRLGMNLVAAFLPAVIIGLAFESTIKENLFGGGRWGLWPIVAAWFVGGVVILGADRRMRKGTCFRKSSSRPALDLSALTWRMAVVIGLAQCLAMWPGVSRSLTTILGGMAVGLSVTAAVEFSFLLGVLTLSAATAVDTLKHGAVMVDVYGVVTPLLGLLVALVAALLAVRWMVHYLQRRSLAIFGYYRIALALITAAMLWWR